MIQIHGQKELSLRAPKGRGNLIQNVRDCFVAVAPRNDALSEMAGKRNAFTIVEIMIAVAIVVLLATVMIVLVSGMDAKAKRTKTLSQMKLLTNAVNTFKSEKGYYPLAVPEDANDARKDKATWLGFLAISGWTSRLSSFCQLDPNDMPNDNITNRIPTNIELMVFQLERVPSSSSIVARIRETANVEKEKYYKSADDYKDVDQLLGLSDTFGNFRTLYQPQDAWKTPLRYWTSDTLKWAKAQGWNTQIQQLLSQKLQQANWSFFIESAGKDKKFGWADPNHYEAKDIEDNIYSFEGN
jgi:type II secretory pathway pseudopilin PulG